MTPQEWQEGSDLEAMLAYVRGSGITRTKPGKRKMRLFACGCARQVEDLFPDPQLRDGLSAAEQYAEGLVKDAAAQAVLMKVMLVAARERGKSGSVAGGMAIASGLHAARCVAAALAKDLREAVDNASMSAIEAAQCARRRATEHGEKGREAEKAAAEQRGKQADLLRELFGNPFAPVSFAKGWMTPTVRSLAQSIHADRAFDRLPVLSDALAEAGCDEAEVLEHCRTNQPHYLGCWVIDGLLGM